VLDFVEFLQSKMVQVDSSSQEQPEISVLTLAQKYMGCVEGSEDLSTNKKYMEGFGA